MTECVLGGLPGAASGDENPQIRTIRPVRPQQVKFASVTIRVLPLVTCAIQIVDGRRIGMAGVEIGDWIARIVQTRLQAESTISDAVPDREQRQSPIGDRLPHSDRYFTPAPPLVAIASCCLRAFSSAWSMLKLDGRCRGGKSLNVCRNCATIC